MIAHCTTMGVESEGIHLLGEDMFYQHTDLFVRALRNNKNWRSIVYLLSEFMCADDPGFRTIINRLGNSDFESNLKSQLNFLSFIEEKRKKQRR